MTKLVLVLAVVVVVILVVVIVAVKNMRAEDPDEFGNQDERDARYDRRRPDRQPVRGSRGAGPTGRAAAGRQARSESRSGGADRGYGLRIPEDQGYDTDQGYDADRGLDQRATAAYDDVRSSPVPTGQERRRRSDNGTGHRPDDAPPRARSGRGRRSEDSSEWDSSEWEKLSDVDYWAELASDKPLTTTAQPAAPQPAAPYSAAPRNGAQRRSGQDRETETLAVRGPVPGAPRRDPATGLPVRGPQQPADADLAATAASRNDFAAAPVPVDRGQDRPRPATGPNRERRGLESQRPAASANGTRRQRPRAASTGERRLPDRQRPPAAPVSESEQRSLAALMGEPSTYLSAGPASLPMPAIRDIPPDRPRDIPRDRPRVAPDDDPLTSPSFPKIPAADSRSYHNGRSNTPANGSRAQSPYPAPARQSAAYDAPSTPYPPAQRPERPAAQYPAAQYPSAQYSERPATQYPAAPYPSGSYPSAQYPERPAAEYPAPELRGSRHRGNGNGSVEADRTIQHGYHPDPLTSPGPYPAGAASASPAAASMPPGPAPVPPAVGNPYGSYVTPDSQPTMASSYDGYAAMPSNGHGQSYQPPAMPGDAGQNRNGYWHQQPSAPASSSSYLGSPAQVPDTDAQTAGYQNGYGQHSQAGYLPSSYPSSQNDPAGYPPVDPYGSDGYGGYPGYGAAER